MWPFPKKRIGELSNAAFARWLRARCPQPMVEFLTLGEDEQETLAGIGDDYEEDRAIALGYAIADPDAAAIGADGDVEPEDVEALRSELAAAAVFGRPQNSPLSPPATETRTMGGITRRRAERKIRDQEALNAPRRLLGVAPDPVTPAGDEQEATG